MSEYTKYLRLMKPQGNEYYNVENFNHNAELIDKETEKLNNAVTKIQEGATTEKAGIVQFGTEEGKALEGMMLARLAGCVGYGGDIQTAGVKDINYIYYDRNTRKMYKCLNQNSDVSANVANFIPLDNNSLLDRLENLNTSDYKILLDKSYISGKNIFTTNEIIWGVSELAEYKKAIKNYPFIVIQFFSSHTSIISSLFKSDNSRLFVPIPNPEGEHTIFQIVESDNSFQVFRTYNFGNIKCTGLRIMGVKIF